MKKYIIDLALFICLFYFDCLVWANNSTLESEHFFPVCCPLQLQAERNLDNVPESQNEVGSQLFYDGSISVVDCTHPGTMDGCTDSGQPVCLLLPKLLTGEQADNVMDSEARDSALYRQQQLLASALFCFFVATRIVSGNSRVSPLFNALATGPASVYLYSTGNQTLSEVVAAPPSFENNAENLLPLVIYAYSAYEMLFSWYEKENIFVLHGFIIFAGSTVSHYTGKLRLAIFGMVVESSQVFYSAGVLYKERYLAKGSKRPLGFFIPFTLAFFGSRLVVIPYESYRFIKDTYLNKEEYNKNPILSNVIVAGGMALNLMNLYWGYMIIKTAWQRFSPVSN
ncbi:TLC domain-containing protein [Endozoicomonas lisbonensis]|uniref:TLC domain-containing protein n=1 Tax=Endozoicomonas lisbonensis TaxID=3120522 RepID=A0ABV2SH46_9GAMM